MILRCRVPVLWQFGVLGLVLCAVLSILYRTKEEEESYHTRDPITAMHRTLVDRGIVQGEELDAIDKKVQDSIDLAWEFGEAAPYPAPEDALTDVYVKYP